MKKTLRITCLLGIFAAPLTACNNAGDYQSSNVFFADKVLVEYKQSSLRDKDDTVSFSFFERGFYHVEFALAPSRKERYGAEFLPRAFDYSVDSPRAKMISQYHLPDHLRITITHEGQTEFHDFD